MKDEIIYLDVVSRAPSFVNFFVVGTSCYTQELAECLRRTFHADVQGANSQETKIFLCQKSYFILFFFY